MGAIRLYGSTSGYLELQAPAVAPDAVLTLPSDSVQPGLVHLHTETFSAVSSVSIDNVFSSQYATYEMFGVLTTATNDFALELRLRASGSNDTSSNYHYQQMFGQNSATGVAATTTSFGRISIDDNFPNAIKINLVDPASASQTGYFHSGYSGYSTGQGATTAGVHAASTAFDGFTLFGASAFSGSIRIYGYRNS